MFFFHKMVQKTVAVFQSKPVLPTTLMELSEEELELSKCSECGGFYNIEGDCPTCKVEPFIQGGSDK